MLIFGGYAVVPFSGEEKPKEELRKQIHSLIDQLCDRDDFWIRGVGYALGPAHTIGWKIAIPHMEETEEWHGTE